ncbi:LysR substrate-binding domain-containing protein [Marinobacterium arenosum]|uniref:LysR substrate-binding domain-containing protein n=1 Tax=Marinobacterium arenosum TaxID=2862496 RepID=UPI001C969A27|nr:LysR substrate-binding domain-containing protein [Marinobacterium arenosum]MBY4677748.1 LysR family transcriptional regulator [Marinobacterium arenosum]
MNSRQLEAFQAVMSAGSMSEAARVLEISQPAVSRLIKDLEATLGFKLFLRQANRLFPTPGANRFNEEVQRHFIGLHRLNRTAEEIRNMKSDAFRLAAFPALADSLLANILNRYLRGQSDLSVSLASLASAEIAGQVAGQQYDLGIVALPLLGDDLQYAACFRSDCRLIAPPGHHFAGQARVSAAELDREPFISAGQPHDISRHRLEQALKDQLARPERRLDCNQSQSAARLVGEGLGVAVVDPFTALHAEQQGLVNKPFDPSIPFYFGFITPLGRSLSPQVEQFIDHFEAQLMRQIPLQPVESSQINHR